MIRIGLLDDHPLIVAGLKAMLQAGPGIDLRWAISQPDELAAYLLTDAVDVLVLDVNLTTADGLLICKQIHRRQPTLRILMLTSYEDTSLVRAAFRNGAAGYLPKSVSQAEMLEAIRAVFTGEPYLARRMQELALENATGLAASSPGYRVQITPREHSVLRLIVNELTNQEVAEALCISVKTVDTHRMNLIQKMGVKNTAGLVRVALEKGLV